MNDEQEEIEEDDTPLFVCDKPAELFFNLTEKQVTYCPAAKNLNIRGMVWNNLIYRQS